MNKSELAVRLAGDTIPEPRVRKFVAGVEKRKKAKAHAKAQAKHRRKRGR